MKEYRKKGILALITVFQDDDTVVRYERQIFSKCRSERDYLFNIYQLCGDVIDGK